MPECATCAPLKTEIVGVGKDLLQLSLKNIYLKKPARLKNDFWQLAATSFAKSKENISPPHPKNGQPPNQPNKHDLSSFIRSFFRQRTRVRFIILLRRLQPEGFGNKLSGCTFPPFFLPAARAGACATPTWPRPCSGHHNGEEYRSA